MDFKSLTLIGGKNKDGELEDFMPLVMERGVLYTIIGDTGSGKSRLIKDIEQIVKKDSVTRRQVLINGQSIDDLERNEIAKSLIAHLSQNMRFILDTTVEEFLRLHLICRGKSESLLTKTMDLANEITPERISLKQDLTTLSGGQTRALMIADIANICDSPVVLIDEIENAGINKLKALDTLINHEKLVLMVTHDPHTALMGQVRLIMQNGQLQAIVSRDDQENGLLRLLDRQYRDQLELHQRLKRGEIVQ